MKPITRQTVLAGLLCLCVLAPTLSYANNVAIGRYLTVAAKPQASQQRLLSQQLQIRFPENVITNKQAINFLLKFRGYRLAPLSKMSQAARSMLQQPLPEVDRSIGPLSLEQALITIAGHAFTLLEDKVYRLISFKLKQSYQSLYPRVHFINQNNKDHSHEKKQIN